MNRRGIKMRAGSNVRQGPDGLLYVLTEENDGALLKMEPWTAPGPGR